MACRPGKCTKFGWAFGSFEKLNLSKKSVKKKSELLRTCARQDGIGQNVVHFPETHRHQDVTAVSAHFGDTHHQRTDLHLVKKLKCQTTQTTSFSKKALTKFQSDEMTNDMLIHKITQIHKYHSFCFLIDKIVSTFSIGAQADLTTRLKCT